MMYVSSITQSCDKRLLRVPGHSGPIRSSTLDVEPIETEFAVSRKPQSTQRRTFAARAFRASWRIALIAFHAVLLAARLVDASIFEPAVLVRWSVTLALLLSAFLFQRFAPARLRGRRAVLIFWLLAALLHLFGPLQHVGHELDLELTLAAASLLAFALLFAAAAGLGTDAGRAFVERQLPLGLAQALSLSAPRGPPLRVVQRAFPR